MKSSKINLSMVLLLIIVVATTGCTQNPPPEYSKEKKNETPLPTIEEFEKAQNFKILLPTYAPEGYYRDRVYIVEDTAEFHLKKDETMSFIKIKEWASKNSSFLDWYGGENLSIEGAEALFVSTKINFISQSLVGYYRNRNLAFIIEDHKGDSTKEEMIKIAKSFTCGNGRADSEETQKNCCLDLGCKAGEQCVYNICEAK